MLLDLESYIGKKYSMLAIVKVGKHRKAKNGKRIVIVTCMCDCGNVKEIRLASLKNNSTKSCGCIGIERAKTLSTKHGLSREPLYRIWHGMKSRCYNPKNKEYHNYGGRGITICEEWNKRPHEFIKWGIGAGWAKGLEIDRENVNGNYEPSNCRFVSPITNARNKRFNLNFTYNGETKTLKEWCDQYGVNYTTVYMRLRLGWDFKKSIETPSLPLFGNKTEHGSKIHKSKIFNDRIERQKAGLEPR